MVDFIDFARSEGRFGKHFDKDGNPSETLLRAKQDRLENWHLLQELAGMLGGKTSTAKTAGSSKTPIEKPVPTKSPEKPTVAQKSAVAKPPKSVASNGESLDGLSIGLRIKYRSSNGEGWIAGVVESINPAVVALDDGTQLRTTADVLAAGLNEGLIVRQ